MPRYHIPHITVIFLDIMEICEPLEDFYRSNYGNFAYLHSRLTKNVLHHKRWFFGEDQDHFQLILEPTLRTPSVSDIHWAWVFELAWSYKCGDPHNRGKPGKFKTKTPDYLQTQKVHFRTNKWYSKWTTMIKLISTKQCNQYSPIISNN